jgi:hypothetical protein
MQDLRFSQWPPRAFFWHITPCGPLKINRRFGGKLHFLPPAECLGCLAYSSAMKTEVTYYSETSAYFQWSTRCYIAEDRILHHDLCS